MRQLSFVGGSITGAPGRRSLRAIRQAAFASTTMDWLSFSASLAHSLAWPGALIVAVFILRRALGRLIPDLNQLKYKDLEIRFGRQLEDVRHELEASPKPTLPPPAQQKALKDRAAEKGGLVNYFESIAEVSPRAAMLEAWIGFETTANSNRSEARASSFRTPRFDA